MFVSLAPRKSLDPREGTGHDPGQKEEEKVQEGDGAEGVRRGTGVNSGQARGMSKAQGQGTGPLVKPVWSLMPCAAVV